MPAVRIPPPVQMGKLRHRYRDRHGQEQDPRVLLLVYGHPATSWLSSKMMRQLHALHLIGSLLLPLYSHQVFSSLFSLTYFPLSPLFSSLPSVWTPPVKSLLLLQFASNVLSISERDPNVFDPKRHYFLFFPKPAFWGEYRLMGGGWMGSFHLVSSFPSEELTGCWVIFPAPSPFSPIPRNWGYQGSQHPSGMLVPTPVPCGAAKYWNSMAEQGYLGLSAADCWVSYE